MKWLRQDDRRRYIIPGLQSLATRFRGNPVWSPARRLMQKGNPRPDPPDRANSTNRPGVSVPAKGDSSGSNPPLDPQATFVDAPASSDPGATFVDTDATLVDASPLPRSPGRGPVRLQINVPVLQTGDVLAGRYEILQLLGEGGMGAVYKARDRELDRFVAIKLIRRELSSNP